MTPELTRALRHLADTPAHRRREVLARAATTDAIQADADLSRGLELLAELIAAEPTVVPR